MDIPGVPTDTSRAIRDMVSESAAETTGGRAQGYLDATKPAQGLLKPNTQAESTLAMNPMSDAIRNKVQQGFNLSQRRLAHETKVGAQVDHLKKLEVASNLANEEFQINQERERIRREMKKQQGFMRGQIIGSVLGIVGGVAGGVAGAAYGGPAGAGVGIMAGSQLGQGVGQIAGGG